MREHQEKHTVIAHTPISSSLQIYFASRLNSSVVRSNTRSYGHTNANLTDIITSQLWALYKNKTCERHKITRTEGLPQSMSCTHSRELCRASLPEIGSFGNGKCYGCRLAELL